MLPTLDQQQPSGVSGGILPSAYLEMVWIEPGTLSMEISLFLLNYSEVLLSQRDLFPDKYVLDCNLELQSFAHLNRKHVLLTKWNFPSEEM